MITKLKSESKYNGMFITDIPLEVPEEVEIIGVLFPVDPGMVAVMRNGDLHEVPSYALQECPNFDFGAMLIEDQLKEREVCGGLVGAGLCVKNRTILPLEQCKVKS